MLGNKKPKALAMLGNVENVKVLVDLFDKYEINLVCENFNTIDEIVKGIKDHKAEYVLVSDLALEGIDNGKYEVVQQIRSVYKEVFIVMFFNREKYDEQFKNWAFGFGVYNLYYAIDKSGNFNFSKIMPEIKEKKMPMQGNAEDLQRAEQEKSELLRQIEEREKQHQDDIKRLEKTLEENRRLLELEPACAGESGNTEKALGDVEPEAAGGNARHITIDDEERKRLYAQNESLERNIEELQKNMIREQEEKYRVSGEIISVREELEAEKEENAKLAVEKEKLLRDLSEARASVTEKVVYEEKQIIKHMSKLTIGIFSVSRGAGATRTAVEMAERLAKEGYKVIVIAFDGKSDLAYLSSGKADYAISDMNGSKEAKLLMAHRADYDFIILDFGMLFHVTPAGDIDTTDTNISDNADDVAEFLKCHYKIGVGFSDDWHFKKLRFYVSKDMFGYNDSTIFSIEGIENIKSLGEMKHLNLCERDNDEFFEILCQLIGIQQVKTRKAEKKKEKEKSATKEKAAAKEKATKGGIFKFASVGD